MADYKKTLQSAVNLQWKAVVKDYPLVAAAVMMGKKELAPVISKELAVSREISELFNGQLDMAAATKVGVRLANCFRNFDKALARAQNSEEVKTATTGLSDCLNRRKT